MWGNGGEWVGNKHIAMAKQSKTVSLGATYQITQIEEVLWAAADKMRNNMDSGEYKHVVLGLIFLKYISDVFEEKHKELLKDASTDPEDKDEYLADNIFWVPSKARWSFLQKNAKQPKIGNLIDDAMDAIEKDNPSLKGVLPKNYARPSLDKQRLGELIDLIGTIGLGDRDNRSKDILGRVYEYFLGQFAGEQGFCLFHDARSVNKNNLTAFIVKNAMDNVACGLSFYGHRCDFGAHKRV